MNFRWLFPTLLLFTGLGARADVSYICASGPQKAEALHLNFSTKAPLVVGSARVIPSGKVKSERLACKSVSNETIECDSNLEKSKIRIKGSYNSGSDLILTEGPRQMKCIASADVNLEAVRNSH